MADFREQFASMEEIIRSAVESRQAEMWTGMPGLVDSVDWVNQTMKVRPAIKAVQKKPDGSTSHVELPVLQDVPIVFPGGGGQTLTFPIKKDDSVYLSFSSRPIDSHHQSDGVQNQVDARMHSLSDGFAFPGYRPQPRKLSNVSQNSTQLRSDDGKSYLEVGQDGAVRMHHDGTTLEIDTGKNVRISPKAGSKVYLG